MSVPGLAVVTSAARCDNDSSNRNKIMGDRLLFHSSHFSCPRGHRWEIESVQSWDADPVSDPVRFAVPRERPGCLSEPADEADLADELPPPPSRSDESGVRRPVHVHRSSRAWAGDRTPVDPPQIAGFEILGELGRGGMGVVYHAKQLSLGRDVALKIVLAGAHAAWSERSRLRAEAETVACMKHPNIVPIYEIGEHDNLAYLALELVEGGSLAEALAKRPMASRQAAEMAEILAKAMGYVHERGVLHRDLKPANVLLTIDGVPKITDFGLAKWLDVPSNDTRSGVIVGTPGYMAPEQARGQTESGWTGYRRLRARGDPLRDADRQATVPRRDDAGNRAAVVDRGSGTADQAPAASFP